MLSSLIHRSGRRDSRLRHTVEMVLESVSQRLQAQSLFYGHGTDNAWDEAVAIVLAVSHLSDRKESLREQVSDSQMKDIDLIVEKRVTERLPLPYVLGSCQFMGSTFLVDRGVIIPRSPIGYLLRDWEWIARAEHIASDLKVAKILDLCCGSGCLGILAAKKFEAAQVKMVDIDPRAVALSKKNIEKHGLSSRVKVLNRDIRDAPSFLSVADWDLILCNPPYVSARDMEQLPAEYLHEPELALAGGLDGLDLFDSIFEISSHLMSPSGILIGEVGGSQAAFCEKYKTVDLSWPDLYDGGEGVFLLERNALDSHT